jgi:D-xylose 1-dehydrogenase (NADP+, D-xylono-1,5-lactone-forming)
MTPSTNKVRWGILGVARINDRVIPGFARAGLAELRAIASRDPTRAASAAKSAGIPVVHPGYEALLDDPEVDAVYVPLPNTMHADWTREAARRGKHVLCEKPLAATAPEAREVVEFCRGHGVCLMEAFMWPHHPRTARLREALDGGAVGEVRRVSGSFTFPLEPYEPTNIRLRPELGGGSLLDVGCYPVYGIRWAFGAEPVRAYATARYDHGVDVEMSGTVWLEDGRVGTFDCGFDLPLRQWLEVVGSEGVISVPEMWVPGARAAFTIRREGKPPEEVVVEGEDQIARMIDDFCRCVLEKRPVEPDPEEAVRTLRVLDALARSAQEERDIGV